MRFLFVISLALLISYAPIGIAEERETSCVMDPIVQIHPHCARPINSPIWEKPIEAEWSITNAGERSGIVNIYAHGSLKGLKLALKLAGYYEAEEPGFWANSRYVAAAAAMAAAKLAGRSTEQPISKPYCGVDSEVTWDEYIYNRVQKMPISIETLGCEPQVAAFQKDHRISGVRHHLRVFNLHQIDEHGLPVWGISAVKDVGIMLDEKQPQRLFLNHRVDPDADLERDFIVNDLRVNALLVSEGRIPLKFSQPPPRNQVYSKDGQAIDIYIKFAAYRGLH